MLNPSTKPTYGNINLMISIEEVEGILECMNNIFIKTCHLVKLDEYSYRLTTTEERKQLDKKLATLTKQKLSILLTAPCGLYNSLASNRSATTKTKFRVELKLEDGMWEIA